MKLIPRLFVLVRVQKVGGGDTHRQTQRSVHALQMQFPQIYVLHHSHNSFYKVCGGVAKGGVGLESRLE